MMTYDEKKWCWDAFSELYQKGITDTIVSIKFGESEETWAYGSFKFDGLENSIAETASNFVRKNPGVEDLGMDLHLVYLPFAVEPIHIETRLTPDQVMNLSAFGMDLFSLAASALVKELRVHISDRFDKLAHSNGMTYRTFDHTFDNTWKDTMKYTTGIDHIDTNNQ